MSWFSTVKEEKKEQVDLKQPLVETVTPLTSSEILNGRGHQGFQTPDKVPTGLALRLNGAVGTGIRAGKNGTVKIRCSRSAAITSSGAGALSLLTITDLNSHDEASGLSGLFSQARVLRTTIEFHQMTCIAPAATVFQPAWVLAVGFDPSAISGSAVRSFIEIQRLGNSKTFNPLYFAPWKNSAKITEKPWSGAGTTSSGLEPFGGQSGGWFYTLTGTAPLTTVIAHYVIHTWFELRIKR